MSSPGKGRDRMSQFLDLMLRPEVPNVQQALPEGEYRVKRLSRLVGADVVLRLKGLPYGKVQEFKEMEKDVSIHILLAGCGELKDPALKEKFGGATPVETVKAMLLPGEIEDLSLSLIHIYVLAVKGLVLHWYDHRGDVITGTIVSEIPTGLRTIINQLKLEQAGCI